MCIPNKWKTQNSHGKYISCSVMRLSIRFLSLRNAEASMSRNRKQRLEKNKMNSVPSSKCRFNREPVSRLPFKCPRGHDATEIYALQTAKCVYHVASGKSTLAVTTQQVHTRTGWDRDVMTYKRQSVFVVLPLASRTYSLTQRAQTVTCVWRVSLSTSGLQL
jgi:hypothetical protein